MRVKVNGKTVMDHRKTAERKCQEGDNRTKVKLYYQEFSKNISARKDENLVLEPESATHICTLAIEGEDRFDIAEQVYEIMNLRQPQDMVTKANYETAGHTSMSIGDYIVFEDGEILQCARAGFVSQRT